MFPEVFYPTGVPHGRQGFHAVLGNPPWEQVDVAEEEYWCRFDLEVLSVSDKHSRQPLIEVAAAMNPGAKDGWNQLIAALEQHFRIFDAVTRWQSVSVGERKTTGRPDMYRLFCERNSQLLNRGGRTGIVVPSAFHANEGATGIRQLYLQTLQLVYCYSFENRRKLFEIDSRFKFACVVARQNGMPTERFSCAFYLHDAEWLFGNEITRPRLEYTQDFVKRTGGVYWTLAECRTQVDADLLSAAYSPATFDAGPFCDEKGLVFAFGVELHRNKEFANRLDQEVFGDALSITTTVQGHSKVFVFEGKCFGQFTDRGEYPLQFCAPYQVVLAKEKWNPAIAYYRLAFRKVAASTNERTLIGCVLRPGVICNESAFIETIPQKRPNCLALALSAVFGAYFVDWQVRQRTGANVNAFIFRATRIIAPGRRTAFLVHSSLRLTCNHPGYAPLLREQLGNAWGESGKEPFTWPVLPGEEERWTVRAAIDAVVADAYGLSREQYTHVLSTFSHSSYSKAPELCLAMFDELNQIGLDAFSKKHDPYWDIPLNENLPQPVIDLRLPADQELPLLQTQEVAPKKRGRKKA